LSNTFISEVCIKLVALSFKKVGIPSLQLLKPHYENQKSTPVETVK